MRDFGSTSAAAFAFIREYTVNRIYWDAGNSKVTVGFDKCIKKSHFVRLTAGAASATDVVAWRSDSVCDATPNIEQAFRTTATFADNPFPTSGGQYGVSLEFSE